MRFLIVFHSIVLFWRVGGQVSSLHYHCSLNYLVGKSLVRLFHPKNLLVVQSTVKLLVKLQYLIVKDLVEK